MTFFKRMLAALTVSASLMTMIPFSASAYDNSNEIKIDGFDCKTDVGHVFVYPNDSDETRIITPDDYMENNFRTAKLLIFNSEGRLIEAGGEIYANSETITGSPQLKVKVPPKGFMVAFKGGAPAELRLCFNTAMEGAMLYNSTMSVIYEVYGKVKGDTLTIEYNNPAPVRGEVKKFLFVGNSSTYFNGTPIKFKGLAKAAGVEIDVDYCTFGSAFLSEFADPNHNRGVAFRNKLKQNKYDYVVLQDAAKTDYYSTKPQVETLLPLIEANGAEALLYMRYSAASTANGIIRNAKKHHDNYTGIAKDFDLVYSPSAHGFIYSALKYPEIPLYADDGGHHSKEGSYLIACTWLMSYLGINPVGNEYLADMPADVAAKLQECAYLACTEEYQFEESKNVYTDNGKEYENLAKGKTYTATGGRYDNDSWTDIYPDGKTMGKLTDGNTANLGDDNSIGAYLGGNGHSITIDLEKISDIKYVKTDLFGCAWGIKDPAEVKLTLSVSVDGERFTDAGEFDMSEESSPNGEWKKRIFSLKQAVTGRYVRISYSNANFVWSSEINVYGEINENYVPVEDSSVLETESATELTSDVEETPETNASLAWLYWLIGGLAAVAVAVASVLISKKRKQA
ncbi:MAG: hypothetical protein E7586_05215 [Ruminococcaceae bacterium]|nr:hypothetical protein [Oscillospiraceae bacterium]